MENNTTKVEQAFMLWWHYQIAIEKGAFKNKTHEDIVRHNEQLWRENWLKETEPFKDSLMISAGFVITDTKRGIYALK